MRAASELRRHSWIFALGLLGCAAAEPVPAAPPPTATTEVPAPAPNARPEPVASPPAPSASQARADAPPAGPAIPERVKKLCETCGKSERCETGQRGANCFTEQSCEVKIVASARGQHMESSCAGGYECLAWQCLAAPCPAGGTCVKRVQLEPEAKLPKECDAAVAHFVGCVHKPGSPEARQAAAAMSTSLRWDLDEAEDASGRAAVVERCRQKAAAACPVR